MVNESDYTIVATYGAEYRGIVQYYLLAGDVYRLHRLHWVMVTSMLKTLAGKHRSSVSKMAARHKAKIADTARAAHAASRPASSATGRKPLVARFGGIPLKRQKNAVLTDRQPPGPSPEQAADHPAPEGRCEICERTDDVQVHHVRNARRPRPARHSRSPHGPRLMAKSRRKTLVVCGDCHDHIHAAPRHTAHAVVTGEPDAGKRVTSGSEGGRAEKDQPTLAPRRAADPTQTLKNWLARPGSPRPPPSAQLQQLLGAFTTTYNHHRPHRSLPGQATPAIAYTARPKASPGDRANDTHNRVRTYRLDANGTVTLRHGGKVYHIGIGRPTPGPTSCSWSRTCTSASSTPAPANSCAN